MEFLEALACEIQNANIGEGMFSLNLNLISPHRLSIYTGKIIHLDGRHLDIEIIFDDIKLILRIENHIYRKSVPYAHTTQRFNILNPQFKPSIIIKNIRYQLRKLRKDPSLPGPYDEDF